MVTGIRPNSPVFLTLKELIELFRVKPHISEHPLPYDNIGDMRPTTARKRICGRASVVTKVGGTFRLSICPAINQRQSGELFAPSRLRVCATSSTERECAPRQLSWPDCTSASPSYFFQHLDYLQQCAQLIGGAR